jgi:flagellar hook assembly protein FlgD
MDSEEMLMDTLFNFPNPFMDQTWFSIEHNRPDSELRLVLTIYKLSGELVRVIDRTIFSPGYRLEPVEWDGTTSGGAEMGSGIYVYRATLSNEAGEQASKSGKLIITH